MKIMNEPAVSFIEEFCVTDEHYQKYDEREVFYHNSSL